MGRPANTIKRVMYQIKMQKGCWVWSGGIVKTTGYGKVGFKGKTVSAHKFFYEQTYGKVEKGLVLDHLCRNRLCVNPKHLEAVTQQENIKRGNGICGINSRKTHCLNGHEFTINNTYMYLKSGAKRASRNCKTCASERTKFYANNILYKKVRV